MKEPNSLRPPLPETTINSFSKFKKREIMTEYDRHYSLKTCGQNIDNYLQKGLYKVMC